MIVRTADGYLFSYTFTGKDNEQHSQTCERLLSSKKKGIHTGIFESALNATIIGYYEELNYNALERGFLVNDYQEVAGAETNGFSQTFSCTYGAGQTAALFAFANDGVITKVFTFMPLKGNSSAELMTIGSMLMIPSTIMNARSYHPESVLSHMSDILNSGVQTDAQTYVLTEDGIKYTLYLSNSNFSFTIELLT